MRKTTMALTTLLALSWILPGTALAANSNPKKNKLNTNLYEQESKDRAASGKVKVVREVQGDTEVFLEGSGNTGPFTLPENIKNRAGLIKILKDSQKPGGAPVTLSIDEQQRIKSVESSGSSTHSPIPEF